MFENLIAALKADKRKIVFTEGDSSSGEVRIYCRKVSCSTSSASLLLCKYA